MDTEVGTLPRSSRRHTAMRRRSSAGSTRSPDRLLWACLGIVALVFTLGLLRAMPPFELFLGAVSLAVAGDSRRACQPW